MTNDKKNNNVYHHVVYSVKGGCGKTTFSLRLLMADFFRKWKIGSGAPKDNEKDEKSERAEVDYLFDMDFLGSSLNELLDDNFERILMDDLIFNGADVGDLILANCVGERDGGEGDARYFIPSSQHENEKERFHVKSRNTPLLRYDEFRHEMAGIIAKIRLIESFRRHKKEKAEDAFSYDINFIYDMPPNADGYTEALFEYLLECAAKGEKVFLYLVFNNTATLKCDAEWLASFVSSGRLTDKIEVYFVSNEIMKDKELNGKKIAQFNRDTVKEVLDDLHVDMGRKFYVQVPYDQNVVLFNYKTEKPEERIELSELGRLFAKIEIEELK